MATRISKALGISHGTLKAHGAFDAFVDIDSHFHVHPALLTTVRTPELAESEVRVRKHFSDVISLLDATQNSNDVFFRRAIKKLQFHEIPLTALGYSQHHTRGRAIGLNLAEQLANTALQIVKAGIKDP